MRVGSIILKLSVEPTVNRLDSEQVNSLLFGTVHVMIKKVDTAALGISALSNSSLMYLVKAS